MVLQKNTMFIEGQKVNVPRATTHSNDKRMTLSIKIRLPTPSSKDKNIFCFRKGELFFGILDGRVQKPSNLKCII